jgi:3-oxoadipate enol-lactonase
MTGDEHYGMRHRFLRWLMIALVAVSPWSTRAASAREGHWILVNGVMLRYEQTGSGEIPVVLVHDMGMNLELWDEVMPALSPRLVLRYDMRGFGMSEKFRTPVTVEDHIQDLLKLMDGLGIAKPVLIGESIGGAIVLKFAARFPERVRAVVAINPLVKMTMTGPPANPSLAKGRDTPKLLETEGIRAYLEEDLDWLYPKELRTPERMNRFMGIEVSQDPDNRASAMRMQKMGVDIHDELPRISCPALLIAGMLNSTYTEEQWREIRAAIPGARLEPIKSAHHAAFESPEMVGPLLHKFLQDVASH